MCDAFYERVLIQKGDKVVSEGAGTHAVYDFNFQKAGEEGIVQEFVYRLKGIFDM